MNFEILKLSFLVLANVENNGYIKSCELNMWDFGFSIILGILFAKLISISVLSGTCHLDFSRQTGLLLLSF